MKDSKYYELVEKMKRLEKEYDTEEAHGMADGYLTEFLTSLGYDELVEVYESIDKWYA